MNKLILVAIEGFLIASVFVFLNSIKPVYAQEYTFGPTINLSNNTGGWPLLAVSENNVYVVWHGGTDSAIVRASNDNGTSFADPLKLKMTVRYIAASGNNVYMLGSSGFDMNTNRIGKITFRASNDNGTSFEPQIDLARGGNIVNLGIIEDPVIAAFANNVYAIWIETAHESWDIFFRASNDNGTSFGDSINLSNSSGMSSYPKIAASGKDVYVVWSEDTDLEGSTDEIFFRASNDGGATFGDVIKLSNDSPFSSYPRIAASGNNVYVAWQDTHKDENGVWERGILFSASNDRGATFGDVISLTEGERSIRDVQIAADGNNVYVAWNDGLAVFFRASKDKGFGFGDSIKLSERAGLGGFQWQPKMAVSGSNVYVLWTDQEEIFFRASNDNGSSFRDIMGLSSEGGSGRNNPIGLAASANNVYAVWRELYGGILFRVGSANLVSPHEWYLGENLQENFLVRYKISHLDYKNGQPFEATLWFGSKDREGNWITDVMIDENGKIVNGTLKLSSFSLTPIADEISPELQPYLTSIRYSLLWLGDYATKISPRELTRDSVWGIAGSCAGCYTLYVKLIADEKVQVAGKLWDTDVIAWQHGSQSKIWVVDDFPLPIKGKVFATTTEQPTPIYFEFELLEIYSIVGTVSKKGCNTIGGNIVDSQMDVQLTQQDEVCKYNDEYFKIRDLEGLSCEDEVKWAKDPTTQRVFEFGTPCDVPSIWFVCGIGYYGGDNQVCTRKLGHENLLEFSIGGKTFIIAAHFTTDKFAIGMQEFNKELKRIILVATTDQPTSLNVTLARELLGGPYSLNMKKGPCVIKEPDCEQLIESQWNINQNATHASFFADLPANVTTIEITGTTAIPEFPIVLLIMGASIVGVIIATKMTKGGRL